MQISDSSLPTGRDNLNVKTEMKTSPLILLSLYNLMILIFFVSLKYLDRFRFLQLETTYKIFSPDPFPTSV